MDPNLGMGKRKRTSSVRPHPHFWAIPAIPYGYLHDGSPFGRPGRSVGIAQRIFYCSKGSSSHVHDAGAAGINLWHLRFKRKRPDSLGHWTVKSRGKPLINGGALYEPALKVPNRLSPARWRSRNPILHVTSMFLAGFCCHFIAFIAFIALPTCCNLLFTSIHIMAIRLLPLQIRNRWLDSHTMNSQQKQLGRSRCTPTINIITTYDPSSV